ncbi:MAG: alanine--tRNA ligase [Patescibacteria group bacterium]
MRLSEVREKFLNFYRDRGHAVFSSASLVPENDPTTLFTGSGMQPLVPYLLGEKHPLGKRITNSQKCFRAEDIDEVGDNRHTTFFEMLGNWSFGDYFKEEQLSWFFDFLTNEKDGAGLDPARLYVSVFAGDVASGVLRDNESVLVWKRLFKEKGIEAKDVELLTEARGGESGMQGGRIFYYDVKKNWWSRAGAPENMPAGEPGGPDSEVFYDFGTSHDLKFGRECHPNCDCGRFLEIGNSVFMEYKKREDGSFEKLAQRNVDFGGGLERITMAANEAKSVFDIDVFRPAMSSFGKIVPMRLQRIIADHIRAAVFLIGDGVLPGNKAREYVVRKLIRRAASSYQRTRRLAVVEEGGPIPGWKSSAEALSEVASSIIEKYEDQYPELIAKKSEICSIIQEEASRFVAIYRTGSKVLEKLANDAIRNGTSIKGEDIFFLETTHGFPLELIKDFATTEMAIDLDLEGYRAAITKHQDLSRTATAGVFKGGLADQSEEVVRLHTTTHLMNAALRKVLGDHVWQKGSNITKERTRFDFTHSEKLTDDEKKEVEHLVNEWISADYEVKKDILSLENARKLGAVGVFGEKYPDMVNVYTIQDQKTGLIISREFCGGPHVAHTGEIGGLFRIAKEEAVAAGIRRIKGVINKSCV